MLRMLRQPRALPPRSTTPPAPRFYVLGMLTAACAVRLAFPAGP